MKREEQGNGDCVVALLVFVLAFKVWVNIFCFHNNLEEVQGNPRSDGAYVAAILPQLPTCWAFAIPI